MIQIEFNQEKIENFKMWWGFLSMGNLCYAEFLRRGRWHKRLYQPTIGPPIEEGF